MSKYEGNNTEELLKIFKELYYLHVAKHGEDHERTIIMGQIYAIKLQATSHKQANSGITPQIHKGD
jgi:hypothetical protein